MTRGPTATRSGALESARGSPENTAMLAGAPTRTAPTPGGRPKMAATRDVTAAIAPSYGRPAATAKPASHRRFRELSASPTAMPHGTPAAVRVATLPCESRRVSTDIVQGRDR